MYEPESDSEDELPPGWEERATLQGEVFYANHAETTTQWTHPRTGRKKQVSDQLPFGWERQILEDNKVIYVDHNNQRTTFTDPRLAFAVEKKNDKRDSFRQRYDGSTRALQILHGQDLSSKVAVVTGANSGVGFEVARALALHGAHVVFACRNQGKAAKAINSILQHRPQAQCSFLQVDLASLASVRQFGKRLCIQHPRLDYLVLNAGVFALPFTTTQDNVETMMQVNYLSSFYLVQLLLKQLVASTNPRVVILSSESHRFSPIKLQDLDSFNFTSSASEFSSMDQYNTSKLFCVLLAQAVHSRYRDLGLKCVAVHPGNMLYTNLGRSWGLYSALVTLLRPFTKSAEQAAGSVVFALCSPDIQDIQGFTYINNCFPTKPSQIVEESQAAEKLWEISTLFLKSRNL